MPNIASVLNEQIRRLSRREIKSQTGVTRKATARYRREIAALKRTVNDLSKRLATMEQRVPKQASELPSELPEGARYSVRTVKAQRARLGLSAKDFGKLVGVAGLTVYGWEAGKSRPRQKQLARLVAIRKIGRREAMKRLFDLSGGETIGSRRTRRSYRQTAEEFITSLITSRKANTSALINVEWKGAGRPGKADNTLSQMVKARKLKRAKLKGERGSRYSVG